LRAPSISGPAPPPSPATAPRISLQPAEPRPNVRWLTATPSPRRGHLVPSADHRARDLRSTRPQRTSLLGEGDTVARARHKAGWFAIIAPMLRKGRTAAALLCCAALAGCGGGSHGSRQAASSTTTATSTAAQQTSSSANYAQLEGALAAYASCMREHGVQIAPPHRGRTGIPELGVPANTSTTSSLFVSALRSCSALARRALALRYGP